MSDDFGLEFDRGVLLFTKHAAALGSEGDGTRIEVTKQWANREDRNSIVNLAYINCKLVYPL